MGHYYQQCDDGVITPMHFVEMASRPGELRPTRISDVRKWWKEGRQVVPSVTTILNVLDKPALVNWKVEQYLLASFEEDVMGRVMAMESNDDRIALIKQRAELRMDVAPSAGTDIHKELELFINDEMPPDHERRGLCESVFSVIADKTGHWVDSWSAETNFVHEGFGGQVDLHNDKWIIDFKSKQSADKFKPGKMAYQEHSMQLAAYREGLGLGGAWARCANVFICLENGEVDFHEHSPAELEKGWQLFQHCLAIWQLQNDYQPATRGG